MERWQVEQLRRSIAMLPEGRSAGALTKDAARQLVEEVARLDWLTARYEEVIGELRRVLDGLEGP